MNEVIDATKLSELRQILGLNFQLFVETYQKDMQGRSQAMIAALAEQNWREIQQQAHSLKGSSSNIGADHIFNICERIEGFANSSAEADVAAELEALTGAIALVEQQLALQI